MHIGLWLGNLNERLLEKYRHNGEVILKGI
jgi:hypothetical protein